jgi:molybdenum cofactor biosynthesis enzyme MoaA
VLRATDSPAEVADYIRSVVLKKEPRHRINDPDFRQPERTMSFIGG